MSDLTAKVSDFQSRFAAVEQEIARVIVGQEPIIHGTLVTILCGGHALLEGVPGLGKTLLIRTLAQVLDLDFNRVQFTPDLMPTDIVGTTVLIEGAAGREFRFQQGPVFTNILLADEINRATPKTQSALLEAMQEHAVTVAGETYRLSEPFFCLATQNPIEHEGTYPLPEAQLDRFLFKLWVPFPDRAELHQILERTTGEEQVTPKKIMGRQEIESMKALAREVPIASHVRDYAVRLVLATHPESEFSTAKSRQFLRFGASPRGAQTLVLAGKVEALLAGRTHVSFDDIAKHAVNALQHRVILNFEGEAEGITAAEVIGDLLERTTRDEKVAALPLQ